MAITSADIQEQIFTIDRKGYNSDEVDVFLERVADEVDYLNARIKELEEELEKRKTQTPMIHILMFQQASRLP